MASRSAALLLAASALVVLGSQRATAETTVFTGSVSVSSTASRSHQLETRSGGTIAAVLGWNTDADLDLYLYDPSGALVAKAVARSGRQEAITYEAKLGGPWRLRVAAVRGGATYSLTVDYPELLASGLTATDRAGDAGIAQTTKSYGTYAADYDLDGDQDFLYNRHAGSEMILYANDGSGHFAQRLPGLFPINDRHDCAWGDVNDDGLPDTYCAVGASGGKRVKANELWLQEPDHTFLRAAGAWGADDPYGRGREPALFDVDGDGRLDLFVGNFYPRTDDLPTKDRLYIQDPPGAFRSAPEYGVDLQIGGQCAEPADFDRDGDTDLMACAHGTNVALKLYRNDGGASFTDVAASHGLTGQWCDALWVDLNLDGRVDLTTMNKSTFRMLLQRSDGTFAAVYERSMNGGGCRFGGGGNRVAAGDVNGDGFPDLYVLHSGYTSKSYNLPDLFFVNDGTGAGFSTASMPQTSQGSGFSVAAIEADGDPPTEFLVTNGRGSFKGPIQLIDFGA